MTDDGPFEHRNAQPSNTEPPASNVTALPNRMPRERMLVLETAFSERKAAGDAPQDARRMRSIGWRPLVVGAP